MNAIQDPDAQALMAAPDFANIVDTLADELNLAFMFQVTATQLLIKIASGQINLVAAAKAELASRRLEARKDLHAEAMKKPKGKPRGPRKPRPVKGRLRPSHR